MLAVILTPGFHFVANMKVTQVEGYMSVFRQIAIVFAIEMAELDHGSAVFIYSDDEASNTSRVGDEAFRPPTGGFRFFHLGVFSHPLVVRCRGTAVS